MINLKNRISEENILTGCICDFEKNMQISSVFRKFGTVFADTQERERERERGNLFKGFYISKPDMCNVAAFLCFSTLLTFKNCMPMVK